MDNGVKLAPRSGSFGKNQYSLEEDTVIETAYNEGKSTKGIQEALAAEGFDRSYASVTYRVAKLQGKR